jgi:integrase
MELPPGVELRNGALRIRFNQGRQRCSETLPYPATQAGIASASRLRDQVVSLNKLGLLDQAKYAELFPNSAKANEVTTSTFGVYAQLWLDSREITPGTKRNYKSALNTWWMPLLATTPLSRFTPALMRQVIGNIDWTSPAVKSAAMSKLSTIFSSAVNDGEMPKNPMDGLELPKTTKKRVDPFSQEEANTIIQDMYQHPDWTMHSYAAFFELAFFSGMRLQEIMALRWEEVDFTKKTAYVCRVVADNEVVERTKTGQTRYVLLNARALHALTFAKEYQTKRLAKEPLLELPYCFPPSHGGNYIKKTSYVYKGWQAKLKRLGIRYRKPYSARHAYATLCLMSGMNPAFIAKQLGHSVEILLSTYAQWLSSTDDWGQMDKLGIAPKLPQQTD